ncbi:TonB family protein [Spirosoma flavum]|uniref:TonB family protein n=1 Tax=Spirosoma flavum TaxID=2048557 RepID=A0ABW6AKN5_9BACT
MRNWLPFLLTLFYLPLLAQSTVYQGFEADSAAEPRGGMLFLNSFIQINLRKPILAEAKGVGGLVVVSAIVETDGHVSDVNVIKSLRPDCDREAVRVFSLYNAWKPAQKDEKVIRQRVSIPVTFKPNAPFIYTGGARINFFDTESKPIADSTKATYRQVTPLDTNGLPAGDIVLYKLKGTDWKEDVRLQFVRKINAYRNSAGQSVHLIGHQNSDQEWEGQLVALNELGGRIHEEYYQNGKKIGPQLSYYENGSIAEKTDDYDEKSVLTSWHPNGQIKQIRIITKYKALSPGSPEQVMAFWDKMGNQSIKDGNGRAIYQTKAISHGDTASKTQLVEQGLYKDGLKEGIWIGRYDDGSYFYEEQYDKGVCKNGKAKSVGGDTLRYLDAGRPPEFPGGMQALGQFLSSNLRYPVEAQKAGVQGKVFVSFVVCTDGTLCDYEVLKGVHPTVDQEALRVIKAMSGRWKPGVQRGEKVRVKYNLPINFTLN